MNTGADRLAGATSLGDVYAIFRQVFREAGVETPELDARFLLRGAFEQVPGTYPAWDRIALDTLVPLLDLAAIMARRCAGEPVARILGQAGFWDMELELAVSTLVPRPDTETVVTNVLARRERERGQSHNCRILDLGTGSGAILLALLRELPGALGVGTDLSQEALLVARRNADRHGLRERTDFVVGHWARAIEGRFDVVVSNPPYIPTADLADLSPEVRLHDPVLALDGGQDGLDAYREIFAALPSLLAPGGLAALEFGMGQAANIRALAGTERFSGVEVHRDLAGRERVIVLRAAAIGAAP